MKLTATRSPHVRAGVGAGLGVHVRVGLGAGVRVRAGLTVGLLLFLLSVHVLGRAPIAFAGEPDDLVAVSLGALQSRLKSCPNFRDCPQALLHLGGLTWIDGYVLDDDNSDIILFGQTRVDLPPLYTEDLVVALRNAWLIYAEHRESTILYESPGCSIDPDASVMRRLRSLMSDIRSSESSKDVADYSEQWENICGQDQDVRVMGVPRESRFARVCVDADYYMKRLVDGSVDLEIDGFRPMTQLAFARVEKAIGAGETPAAIASMNRFWFHPGENAYSRDDGIVNIDACPVVLRTEEQFMNPAGLQGTGTSSATAETFASSFSAHYREVARLRPVYSELEGLFRLVAVAKILQYQEVGADLEFFLHEFRVPRVEVERTLPGLSNIESASFEIETAEGPGTLTISVPICGGVGIDMVVGESSFSDGDTDELSRRRKAILDARGAGEEVRWTVTTNPPEPSESGDRD